MTSTIPKISMPSTMAHSICWLWILHSSQKTFGGNMPLLLRNYWNATPRRVLSLVVYCALRFRRTRSCLLLYFLVWLLVLGVLWFLISCTNMKPSPPALLFQQLLPRWTRKWILSIRKGVCCRVCELVISVMWWLFPEFMKPHSTALVWTQPPWCSAIKHYL